MEEGWGRTATPLMARDACALGTCEEAGGACVLDSCNYSKGLVEIRLEHMDDSLPFFQMLPFSYSGIAIMTGLYYLT